MKSYLNHLQVNIDFSNILFYTDLMDFLGWKIIIESSEIVGYESGSNGSIWFTQKKKEFKNDYDAPGVNHIGIGAESILFVDELTKFLMKMNIRTLFGTPRYRPEFSGETRIYYQVMFESPDGILFEVVCTSPKPAASSKAPEEE